MSDVTPVTILKLRVHLGMLACVLEVNRSHLTPSQIGLFAVSGLKQLSQEYLATNYITAKM